MLGGWWFVTKYWDIDIFSKFGRNFELIGSLVRYKWPLCTFIKQNIGLYMNSNLHALTFQWANAVFSIQTLLMGDSIVGSDGTIAELLLLGFTLYLFCVCLGCCRWFAKFSLNYVFAYISWSKTLIDIEKPYGGLEIEIMFPLLTMSSCFWRSVTISQWTKRCSGLQKASIVDCSFENMFSALFMHQQTHRDKQTQQTAASN